MPNEVRTAAILQTLSATDRSIITGGAEVTVETITEYLITTYGDYVDYVSVADHIRKIDDARILRFEMERLMRTLDTAEKRELCLLAAITPKSLHKFIKPGRALEDVYRKMIKGQLEKQPNNARKAKPAGSSKPTKCFKCGKKGHLASKCYSNMTNVVKMKRTKNDFGKECISINGGSGSRRNLTLDRTSPLCQRQTGSVSVRNRRRSVSLKKVPVRGPDSR
jgi:hypothetical protein